MAEGAIRLGRRPFGSELHRTASGIALALLLALPGCTPARPRNAVLIVLDTLRADRLSGYGNPRPTSPVLDALAERGVRFETVVTNTPWTLPAMAALMTGEYPSARSYQDGLQRSLVERLRASGFATAAFTEGGYVSRNFGFDRGFDVFRENAANPPEFAGTDAHKLIDTTFSEAQAWLAQHDRGRPFFLMLHTYETHTPYRRRTWSEGLEAGRLEPTYEVGYAIYANKYEMAFSDAELEYVRALYDGGVSEADRHVGELLATLSRLGLEQDTLVAVTSDHGEDLGDRKPMRPGNHGHSLYDEQMLVPLILYDPSRRYPVQSVSAQVRLVDVLVTICERLGLPPESDRHGRSLVPLMTGDEKEDRVAYLTIPFAPFLQHESHSGIRSGRFKLIVNPAKPGKPRVELYDLANDAGERSNRAAADPQRLRELARELERVHAELAPLGSADFQRGSRPRDAAHEERLRSLGYVE
jgi:arylsulfatase A-like enzyme